MEPPYAKLDGVTSVVSGYMGGHTDNPTYEQVCRGQTGHAEVVQVTYDPAKAPYEKLLETFWMNIDPTCKYGQFADMGTQYRPEVFYHTDEQKELAKKSRQELQDSGRFDKPIVVDITPASVFYPAEDYHQEFYKTNEDHYNRYRFGSGRAAFLDRVWDDKA